MMTVLTILAVAGFATPLLYRMWGDRAAGRLALLPASAFAFFATQFSAIRDGSVPGVEYTWLAGLGFDFSLRLDGLGLLFALLITGIGSFVVWYAGAYLKEDPAARRFIASVFLFMASMLGVVLADNIIALFVFWELTSFTSYLLIGHYHEEEKSRKAALQALLVTGLGGLFLLAGLLLLGQAAGSYNLSDITALDELTSHPRFSAALALILIGAFTKSAQFPFHFWLPNAMAAPTPASAYLHSSTMVKAGVYLLARLHPACADAALWQAVVPMVGAITLLVGATMAYGQTNLKRLLAYTTVGALGAMTMLLGLGSHLAVKAAMTFLLAHALYKASLFLVAGIIDHETGEKDVTKLGGLRNALPYTALGGGLAALSMLGLPPFFGFLAKETLYAAAGAHWMTAASVLGGAFFMAVAYLTGIKPFRGEHHHTPRHPHEAPIAMWSGPVVMGVLGLLFGVCSPAIGAWLVAPAAHAVAGEAMKVKLELWQGVNRELILSILTFGLGVLAIVALSRLRPFFARLSPLASFGPERGYDRALKALVACASGQTRVLQNGSLRNYLLITLLFVLVTGGWYFSQFVRLPPPGNSTPVKLIDAVILALILLSTFGAIFSRSRMAAIASLGVVGYGIAIFFVLYSAPDLAMTQLVIETLTVILLVLAFYHLPPFRVRTAARTQLFDLVPATLVGLLMAILTLAANRAHLAPKISDYFSANSWTSAYGKNIVNVILVDFRALDTLGEITVLVIAGLGAIALLKLRMSGRGGTP